MKRLIAILCIFTVLSFYSLQVSGQRIASDSYNTLYVCPNGDVMAWGKSEKLGNGSSLQDPPATTPVHVKNLSDILAVSLSYKNAYALRSDGTVWAWGSTSNGTLGIGENVPSDTGRVPVQVTGLTDIVSIDANHTYAFALREDGTVWAWGENRFGRLGVGNNEDQHTPVQIENLSNVVYIKCSGGNSVALDSYGNVWNWGRNDYGQLGDGTTTDRHAPVRVKGLTDVIEVKIGGGFTIALKSDGTVWSWGFNRSGQLGDGTTIQRHEPVQVKGLSNIKTISAGYQKSHALKEDGTAWSWGWNGSWGLLGDGTTTNRHEPVQVFGLSGVVDIVAHNNYSLALMEDGTLRAWGLNNQGYLGDGTNINWIIPVKVKVVSDVVEFPKYGSWPIARTSVDSLFVWGPNTHGRVGDGTTTDRLIPYKLPMFPATLTEIHGTAIPEPGTVHTYTAEAAYDNTTYAWTIPDDWTVISGQDSKHITVLTGNSSGEICVFVDIPCTGRSCKSIRPHFTLVNDTLLCEGDALILAPYLLPGEQLTWNTGATNDTLIVTEAGTYTATVTSDTYTLSATINVDFAPRPVVYIGPDSAFCGEIDYLLDPHTRHAHSYKWSTGDTTRTLYINSEGIYSLRVESEHSCANADTTELTSLQYPYAISEKHIETCETEVKLNAGNPGADYLWSTGETSQTITVDNSGTYRVAINNGYCTIEDEVTVRFIPSTDCQPWFWLPNAFSPNGDGINDVFIANYNSIENYSITIYDRWGSELFHSNNPAEGWDGTRSGKKLPEGVYVYTIYYEFIENEVRRQNRENGTVHLMR